MVYNMFSPVKLLAYECTCESIFRMFKQLQTVRDQWAACWDHSPVHSFNRNIGGWLFAQVKLATQLVFLFAISPLMTCGSQGRMPIEISMEVSVPRKMDVLWWKILLKYGWFRGTSILGDLHMCPVRETDWTHGIMFRISKNFKR